jgi:hypothetical protein
MAVIKIAQHLARKLGLEAAKGLVGKFTGKDMEVVF